MIMKDLNRKGVGLIMAVMISLVLALMASGFFIVTKYMTQSSQNELEKVRLYWAAESGSNYSVNWWIQQADSVRIGWPYYYKPEENSFTYRDYVKKKGLIVEVLSDNDGILSFAGSMGAGAGGGILPPEDDDITPGMMDDYDWDAGTTAGLNDPNAWATQIPMEYHDNNGYKAEMTDKYALGCLPSVCNGLTVNNEFYLHGSSEKLDLTYPNSDKSYTLYLLRYKGERIDEPENAVWVMDTWAVDKETNNAYRVLMSNVMNYKGSPSDILQYGEGIVNSMYGAGFNGRKGVYKDYDYRFGHSYFASMVRFDYKTQAGQGPTGPTFWGRIHSSDTELSKYGGAVGNPSIFTPGAYSFDMGLYAEGLFKTEAEAAEAVQHSVLGGWEHVKEMDTESFAWSWESVESEASTTPDSPIYMLSPTNTNYPAGAEISVRLVTDTDANGETITIAYISCNGTEIEKIQVGEGMVQALAVPSEYGDVSIEGVSSDYFSLITEEDVVKITGSLYLAEMSDVYNDYLAEYSIEQLADPTMDMLAKLYEVMYDNYPDAQLSVFSGLALTSTTISDYLGQAGGRDNQLDFTECAGDFAFCTVGFYVGEGDVAVSPGNEDLAFYNIGSLIINSQGETSGSNSVDNPSSSIGMVFIQDKRFYDDDFNAGLGWGPGPDMDGPPLTGLNPQYRWVGGFAGKGVVSDTDFDYLMR